MQRHVGGGIWYQERKGLYSDYFYFLSDVEASKLVGKGSVSKWSRKKSLKESLEELYSEWPGKMPSYMVNFGTLNSLAFRKLAKP